AVVLLLMAIPTVMFLRGLFGYLNSYLLQWTAVRAIADLRLKLFGHLLNLSSSFFDRATSGELISRVMNDTAALQHVIGNITGVIVKDPVTLVSLLAYLLWQQPKLTLISMVVLPVCMIPVAVFSRKIRRSSRAAQTHVAELSSLMGEAFAGNRIVKAYNLENRLIDQFRTTAKKFVRQYMRIVRSAEIPGPLLEFVGSVSVAAVLMWLAFGPSDRPESADFLAVVLAIFSMYRPLKNLTRLHNQLEQARASSQRVFELLNMRSALPEPPNPVPLNAAGAEIEFDHVDFAYNEKPVLRNVSLRIAPGQLVAVVGASGSGKSSLASLLMRFYDPQRGAIRIGGVDLRNVAMKDLRSQIAVVTQETVLFNDTIRRNIAMGRPGATDEEIEAAARCAHAHDFIMSKPGGYDAVVGQAGVTLSGGERQRIAIARAILKNAPILILDEATSALDSESERAVQAALDELMRGRTTICIAHRLATVRKADVILVLDEGRIVEIGTHSELLARGGVYRKLYDLQSLAQG
ncbi:MAG: ABC transporter ATP-binding protein/permease, partial [Verrucomicrobiae bacterium]|nr:ABC transporter ATP-binding protein/permease [Verrucomicrobiae bacterium]